jgi:uncharacterized protein (DUF111 family)
MTMRMQGYGAGRKDFARANVLRLWVGETANAADGQQSETLTMLSTNLDDMNPEWLPPLLERLLAAGALDAWLTPILMKKGRPAHTLTVLCAPAQCAALRTLVFQHTSTLGVREATVLRTKLQREVRHVETPWGAVSVKIARLPDGELRAALFADCRDISDAHDAAGACLPRRNGCVATHDCDDIGGRLPNEARYSSRDRRRSTRIAHNGMLRRTDEHARGASVRHR